MDYLKQLWNYFLSPQSPPIPHYGRGLHTPPNPNEQKLFAEASSAFMKGERLRGFELFLTSLTPLSHPLPFTIHDDRIEFQFTQGLAIIRGTFTHQNLNAQSVIMQQNGLNVALKRHLLERNFQLTYAKFCNHDGIIELAIHLNNATITPQKIFFPLRELSLNADFAKEIVEGEFGGTELLEYDHITIPSHQSLTSLHRWMLHWIEQTQKSLIGLLSNDNTGMVSFSYLSLLLQIDYLIIPRKKMAQEIAEKVNGYFLEDEKLAEEKNADLHTYITELSTMSLEQFSSNIYRSEYTFSPFDPALHDDIASFIDDSLAKVRWYKSNHSHYVIGSIYRYISLYVLYNYGLHPTLRALFHLHVQIYCSDFFGEKGESVLYHPSNNRFETSLIAQRIDESMAPYQTRYPGLKNFASLLNYSDLDHFSQSFYLQIKNLDFSET